MATMFYTMFGYDPGAPLWLDQKVVNFREEIEGDPVMHLRKMQQLARAQVHHNNQHYQQQ